MDGPTSASTADNTDAFDDAGTSAQDIAALLQQSTDAQLDQAKIIIPEATERTVAQSLPKQ